MFQHDLLRVAKALVLVIAVVHASDQGVTSACLHAQLALESQGINFFEVTTNAVSGIIFYFFTYNVVS